MTKRVAIGIQNFETIRENNYFYVDKTSFIKEWWESGDSVTLISRPRRFGKTLNMSMAEHFFSVKYADRGRIFEGLSIWEEENYRKLQGTYPVISLSFADVKSNSYELVKKEIYHLLVKLYEKNSFLLDSDLFSENQKAFMKSVSMEMDEITAIKSVQTLCDFLYRYYGKRVIVLLDEYDTPMQEAYVNGFWKELVSFTRGLFNSTFKTNPSLERGLMTGITRVSKESIFSDLNNLKVVTTTSDEYATSFGFTEEEVFKILEECGLENEKEKVKWWYDGFVFGHFKDIYNPWSVLNYLDTRKFNAYWANTSSNSLVAKLIREGSKNIKITFEKLLKGESIFCSIDEQIVYDRLDKSPSSIWSLLVASGYLKVLSYESIELLEDREPLYELALTNHEVEWMFKNMVRSWFGEVEEEYNDFIKALLSGNVKEMNAYMNSIALQTFSYFDTGKGPSGARPERFYHGFVLGLLVALNKKYVVTSNRESGYGRCDVMLEPRNLEDNAFILEFKVYDSEEEDSLKDTVQAALDQMEEKQYEASLVARGIRPENIRKYGFAFQGKKVLIG